MSPLNCPEIYLMLVCKHLELQRFFKRALCGSKLLYQFSCFTATNGDIVCLALAHVNKLSSQS